MFTGKLQPPVRLLQGLNSQLAWQISHLTWKDIYNQQGKWVVQTDLQNIMDIQKVLLMF